MTSPSAPPAPRAAASTEPPPSPYRGIESFRYVDRQIFFVREAETERLSRYVTLYRGVLLYGDSGTGKSSLVNAGLIPAALAEGFTPDRLRVQPRPGEEIVVERIPDVADSRPVYLPSNFAGDEDRSPRTVLSVRAFRNTLKFLHEVRPDARPLLIFDQFEEFVTLFEKSAAGEAARAAQEAILEALVEALRDQTMPVKIILAFREDYLAKLNKLFALCPNLPDQFLRLTPPRVELARHIIRGPFEKFPGHFRQELSPELAADIASAIAARSEQGVLNLSELQIACLRLWQWRNPEALFRNSGVEGLLEDYLSESVGRLDAELRDPAAALLTRMVTASGTRNVISEDDLISLVHVEERTPPEQLKKALDALEKDTRLVRRERRRDTYFYEIVSEFLIPWIARHRQERAELRLARRAERKRLRAYVLAITCLLVAVLAIIFARERIRKNEEVVNSDRAVREATAARREAEEAKADALKRLQDVEDANRRLTSAVRITEGELKRSQAAAAAGRMRWDDARASLVDVYKWYGDLPPNPTWQPPPLPETVQQRRKKVVVNYAPWTTGGTMYEEREVATYLSDFGFQINNRSPAQSEPPNVIRCGSQVGVEDVKRVAVSLMRAGVPVASVEPSRSNSSSIQLARVPDLSSVSLRVEDVDGLSPGVCRGG